ncbi:MAG TPA: hypothetical protein RMH85_32965 [Polyangiaceae bacterium LLY-WYZ-15_(1-7)]|nr:hypothetical protein [Myxococcales bacterium]HJL00073.1 hypothetical protein [Polyangiaceae bacterium LLY-WYZ-15_(1-7)]HJL13340.1 hypothetical protein [Polyangiaceae bacterium LLY-WYZ-15_(1-7)]HJL22397.1 hypothetical protein [Polyangiaceae bacterium LLY-WYZ-15_(1-7)]HJL38426.1 hypothetical protein [Polyangiaceae bacterium LLY-WYZ-15_(1-7)]
MADQLDDLMARARRPPEAVPQRPAHPRVVTLPLGEERFAWGLVLWSDPGGPEALHAAIRPLVEGALLAELTRAPAALKEDPSHPERLRLVAFAEVPRMDEALRAFGLRRAAADPLGDELARHARGEASAQGWPVPDEVASHWEVELRGQDLHELEQRLRQHADDEVFGARPGAFFGRLNAAREGMGREPLPPTLAGLERLEEELVLRRPPPPSAGAPGPLRWIPPLCFQGLCDAVAVVAATELGRTVQWAPSEPDEDGFTPPPLVRARLDGDWVHVPLGAHLLGWCVMPLQPGEVVPPLAEWVLDQFAQR